MFCVIANFICKTQQNTVCTHNIKIKNNTSENNKWIYGIYSLNVLLDFGDETEISS